ncbi:MAG: FtsX-like permease family protein [Clostridia bacterium]
MLKGKFYFKSLSRIIKHKPMYALLLMAIICFSTIFSAYVYRLGLAFAYDSIGTEAPYFYWFDINDTEFFDKDTLPQTFKKFGYIDNKIYVDKKCQMTISCEGKGEEFKHLIIDNTQSNVYNVVNEENKVFYKDLEKYLTDENIINQKKYFFVNNSFEISPYDTYFNEIKLDELIFKFKTGDEVTVNGVKYSVIVDSFKVNDYIDESGVLNTCANTPFLIVESDELVDTYNAIHLHVKLNERISNKQFNAMADIIKAEKNFISPAPTVVGFFVLSFIFCTIFVINGAILFKFFIKSQDKLYITYKMLGAKFSQILLTMTIQTVPICIIGTAIGIGIDFLLAPITKPMGKLVTLDVLGVVLISLLNILGMVIGFLIACRKQAKALPLCSEKPTKSLPLNNAKEA